MKSKFSLSAAGTTALVVALIAPGCARHSAGDCEQCTAEDSPSSAAGAGGTADESSAGQAGSLADAGDAGADAGRTEPECSRDADCNDGKRCNGEERCLSASCRPGKPIKCSNAAVCVEDARLAACAYPDAAPWLTYIADEDTPGVEELYAVKESLIGQQEPIKINAPLPELAGTTAQLYSWQWTTDATWLIYGVTLIGSSSSTRWYAVRFAAGMPEPALEISQDLAVGQISARVSPSGHDVLLFDADGDLYLITLGSTDRRLKINTDAAHEPVHSFTWAQGGVSVAYTTSNHPYYVSSSDFHPVAFAGSAPSSALWSSPNGDWLSFYGSADRTVQIARANRNQPLVAIGSGDLSGRKDWIFSNDSHYLVYSASEHDTQRSEVYLVDLERADLQRVTLQEDRDIDPADSLGRWSPDSSYFVFFDDATGANPPDPNWKDVNVYDVATHRTLGLPDTIRSSDQVLAFQPRSKAFLVSASRDDGVTSELLAISKSGGVDRLQRNTLGDPYHFATYAADGSGVIFCSGNSSEHLFYVDLRGDGGAFDQSVELPGEGSVTGCDFGYASDSKGFAYYRSAPDGSRTLYWVDATQQLLGKPQQVTRHGRARFFDFQPNGPR